MKECLNKYESKNENDEGALHPSLSSSILDSSLTSETFLKIKPKFSYNIKIIKCGSVYQLYFLNNIFSKNIDSYVSTKNEIKFNRNVENIFSFDIDNLISNKEKLLNDYKIYYLNRDFFKNINNLILNKEKLLFNIPYYLNEKKFKNINNLFPNKNEKYENRNINRSRNELCRLISTNFNKIKSFITLTFNKDITNIDFAMKEFHKYCIKVRRIYKDFLYIGVIEFQKNGRIHFHILTNIDYNNKFLINENIVLDKAIEKNINLEQFKEENIKLNKNQKMNDLPIVLRLQNSKLHNTKKIFNSNKNKIEIFKTLRFWNCGYSQIKPIDVVCIDDSSPNGIVRYMGKYLTKGKVDSRLFNKKKYFCSQNVERPKVYRLDSQSEIDKILIASLFENKIKEYHKDYKYKFEDIIIPFYELTLPSDFDLPNYVIK